MGGKAGKLTGQQEIFCREFVRLGVAHRAYRKAYKVGKNTLDNSVYQQASVLLSDPKISSRVQALREKIADVTINSLVSDMYQHRELAMEVDQPGAANQAVLGIAKIRGFLKDDPTKAGDIHLHFDGLLKGVL